MATRVRMHVLCRFYAGDERLGAQVAASDFSMASDRQLLASTPLGARKLHTLTVESATSPDSRGKRSWVRSLTQVDLSHFSRFTPVLQVFLLLLQPL